MIFQCRCSLPIRAEKDFHIVMQIRISIWLQLTCISDLIEFSFERSSGIVSGIKRPIFCNPVKTRNGQSPAAQTTIHARNLVQTSSRVNRPTKPTIVQQRYCKQTQPSTWMLFLLLHSSDGTQSAQTECALSESPSN